jgi:hypothetical protein
MITKLKAFPRWLATIIALVLGTVLGGGIGIAAAAVIGISMPHATGSGPYFPQGTVVNECINLLHENESYFELHSSELGNCAGGYVQLSLSADPDAYAIPSGVSGSADIVTVGYPGAQTAMETDAFVGTTTCTSPAGQGLQLSATSSEGHSVSWALTSSPAGLAGAGELTINTATGCISGTPGVTGTYDLTATATDTTGASGSTTFAITIS